MNSRGLVLLVATSWVPIQLSCTESTEPARPADLSECYVGRFFADCGGSLGPALGCSHTTRECRWFVGGAVPLDHEASPCSASELCCVDGHPLSREGEGYQLLLSLSVDLLAWGDAPWEAARESVLTVAVDDTLTPGTPALTCTGEPTREPGPCESPEDVPMEVTVYDSVFVTLGRGVEEQFGGWQLGVEIVEVDGSLKARACRLSFSDSTPPRCEADAPVCATAGSVRIDALPATSAEASTLTLEADLEFGDGRSITVRTVPE